MAVLRELAALVALALFVVGLGSAGLALTDPAADRVASIGASR